MEFNLKTYKLLDIYDSKSGLSKNSKEFGFGYDFLTFKDIFYNWFIPENLTEKVNSSEKDRQKASIKRGDVFLTRTSETLDELGMSSVALRDYPNATFNGFAKRLRPKKHVKILPEYAGYFFRSNLFRNQINQYSSMTTRASLNNSILSELTIQMPDIMWQKRIADILYSVDKKIEINKKIIENLEAQAQAIFKSWFVDFEPFQDGNFVESELGLIPEGWEVKKLGDETNLFTGYPFKSKSYVNDGKYKILTIKNIDDGLLNLNTINKLNKIPEKLPTDAFLKIGDVVFTMTGNVGRTSLVHEENILLNQRVGKIVLNNIEHIGYYYFMLRNNLYKII